MSPRRSKRISCKIRRTSLRIPCSNPYSSSNFSRTMKPCRARVSRKYLEKGVERSKSGKYVAFVWDPFEKKCVWLGSFRSLKEAREVYTRKKREFEDQRDQRAVSDPPLKNLKDEDDIPNQDSSVISESNASNCLQQQQVKKEPSDDSQSQVVVKKKSLKFVLRRIRVRREYQEFDDLCNMPSKKCHRCGLRTLI